VLISKLCNEADFRTEWHADWCNQLKKPLLPHRKYWEYSFIAQALFEHGALAPGKKGLGFAVGKEPLPALFAAHGCEVTASDLESGVANRMGWDTTIQNAHDLRELNAKGICDPEQFARLVSYAFVDMNHIPASLENQFDFTWSTCSFEHCGSILLGQLFIFNQMKCLRPGGIAVHTTEFNLSSDQKTLNNAPTVLYRRQDIDWLAHELRRRGYEIAIDYAVGNGPLESSVDLPPYGRPQGHIRLQIGPFVATSIGLIIKRP
jgi:SAM-dependent methyltransferase